MTLQTLAPLLKEHPFFSICTDDQIEILLGCATNVVFHSGDILFKEGESADVFYVIREGSVTIDQHMLGRGVVSFLTLGAGDIAGWSWLIPPYKYQFDARVSNLTRAFALNGKCLREKCEGNPALGYTLLKQFSGAMVKRLHDTRMQLMNWHLKENKYHEKISGFREH